jgi:hypothetical protein
VLLATALALTGCGSSGTTNPSSGTSSAVAATVGSYFDALRQGSVAGVQATLAPDYAYDPGILAPNAANPFDAPLGLTYRTLNDGIDSLTTTGGTATATVTTTFQGTLNLGAIFAGQGRPAVNGSSRTTLELQERAGEWKITAVRPVRVSYVNPQPPTPALSDYLVNGQTALEVTPGTPLRLTGTSDFGTFIIGVLGQSFVFARLAFVADEAWELQMQAPAAPGRYLSYALLITLFTDTTTGAVVYLAGDQITIPVTVIDQATSQ